MTKKIFMLLPDLSAGGAERVSITIARLLQRKNYDVQFVNLGKPNGEMLDWITPEFNLSSFGCKRVLSAVPKLIRFMRKHSEATYFSSREHVSLIGLFCSLVTGSKMIVRVPNMPKNKLVGGVEGIKAYFIKSLNKWLLRNAKWVIAQNKEMKRQLIDFYGLIETKVVSINNPVDRDYILEAAGNASNPFANKELVFLSVCNIAYSKGIDILLKAWKIVNEILPNSHLYIIGRNDSNYAKSLILSSKDNESVSFMGFQSNPYPFLKFCNCFVLPSRMEGFPNVVLEAMCFNRPVVSTTCVDVIKDIITPGVNGYYCDIENSEAIADCMIKAIKLNNIENNYKLFDLEQLLNVFR